MDIKPKAHLLKTRAKELGYEIKLTHAQEMVASIFGHQSRHSALLADNNKTINTNSLDVFKKQHEIANLINIWKNESDPKAELNWQKFEKEINSVLVMDSESKKAENENDYSDSRLENSVDFASVGIKVGQSNAKKFMEAMNEANFQATNSIKFKSEQDQEIFEAGLKLGVGLRVSRFYGFDNFEKWLDNLKTGKVLSPVNRVLKEALVLIEKRTEATLSKLLNK